MGLFSKLSKEAKIGWGMTGLLVLGVMSAVAMPTTNQPVEPESSPVVEQVETEVAEEALADVVEKKTVTEVIHVPFESITQNDASLVKGKTILAVAGVNGERTIAYEVTYTNGVETSRTQISDVVTKQPVTQVTKVGTYVAPAPAPTPSNTAPAGATARCNDGTYSYSQNRRGTCSHHGGVAEWL